jgi:hypothetical protein
MSLDDDTLPKPFTQTMEDPNLQFGGNSAAPVVEM